MGVCQSSRTGREDLALTQRLKMEFDANQKVIKLLLLGASETGKSTLMKQIRILHANGYTESDRFNYKPIVVRTLLWEVANLVRAMRRLELTFHDGKTQKHAQQIEEMLTADEWPDSFDDDDSLLVECVKSVWADPGVQLEVLPRGAEFNLFDNLPYFIANIDRLSAVDYIPSLQDILMVRVLTTSVVEMTFSTKNQLFKVFDVGGQRNERRKWIHCFDNIQALIYVIAISEFDQMLAEDANTNRLVESMRIFRSIFLLNFFSDTAMILFLNKKDLFAEKLAKGKSIHTLFNNYKGDASYESQVAYLRNRFLLLNTNPNKRIYAHETCATDTNQVELVLDSTFDSIVQALLHGVGMN